jgi:histidine ammonia-lyase
VILLRAAVLARGQSGVRVLLGERLCELLGRGVHPVIPWQGSVGASGDLAPLAHLALVVIGEGEAELGGEILPGARGPGGGGPGGAGARGQGGPVAGQRHPAHDGGRAPWLCTTRWSWPASPTSPG